MFNFRTKMALAKISLYFSVLALSIAMCGGAPAQEKLHFVIDPGHGGKDPGCQQNKLDEKDLTLDLSKRIQKILTGRGYSVTLTRDDDTFIGLEERAKVANRIPGSVLVSIHFNSHHLRSVTGIETFYWPGSERSQKLASYIQGELGRRIVTRNRGFKPQELKVLGATKGSAALVECGFISNQWEAQRCGSAWFRQVLAEEISQGLMRFSGQDPDAEESSSSASSAATTKP